MHTHATWVQNTTLYSDGTTHIKQHCSKGVQPNGSLCANNNCIDMSKVFNTINIHTVIRKLLQTKIPGTIIKLIANYIKGCKAYTTYRNHTSSQCLIQNWHFTMWHPFTNTIQHLHCRHTTRAPVQIMVYADDITSTSTSASKKYIQP